MRHLLNTETCEILRNPWVRPQQATSGRILQFWQQFSCYIIKQSRGRQIRCQGHYKTGYCLCQPMMGEMSCNRYSSLQKQIKKSFLALRKRVGWEIRKLKMDKVNWQEFSRGREKSTNTKQWHHRTALALHLLQDCSQFSAIAVKASIWFWIRHSTHKGTFQ